MRKAPKGPFDYTRLCFYLASFSHVLSQVAQSRTPDVRLVSVSRQCGHRNTPCDFFEDLGRLTGAGPKYTLPRSPVSWNHSSGVPTFVGIASSFGNAIGL